MRRREVRIVTNGQKVTVGKLSDADAVILHEWADMFRNNNHPDVALLSTDERHITRSARGQNPVLNIVGAWKLFHEKLGSPRMFAIQPSAVSPTLDRVEYVRVRWTGLVSPLKFTDQDQHVYQVQSFPTHAFEGVFRASDLPPGTYSINELVFTHVDMGEAKILDAIVFSPIPEQHIQRAWQQVAEVLRHRGHRAATEEEVQSFISVHDPQGISFCMDPLRPHGENVVWRSPEFIATFGDVYWLEVECQSYDDVIIGVLKRLPHLGDLTMHDINGQKRTFHTRVVYGLKSAPHALLIGTWLEGDAPDALTRFCEHEKRLDPTFAPTPYTSLRIVYGMRMAMYKMRGYRVANDDEIAAARERVTNRFGAVMDLMRPFEKSYVWLPKAGIRVFGAWPPVEFTGSWWEYLKLMSATKISVRVQTRSGEIMKGTSTFEFLNDETRLLIVNSVYENFDT